MFPAIAAKDGDQGASQILHCHVANLQRSPVPNSFSAALGARGGSIRASARAGDRSLNGPSALLDSTARLALEWIPRRSVLLSFVILERMPPIVRLKINGGCAMADSHAKLMYPGLAGFYENMLPIAETLVRIVVGVMFLMHVSGKLTSGPGAVAAGVSSPQYSGPMSSFSSNWSAAFV
jgi:hypothetical protein